MSSPIAPLLWGIIGVLLLSACQTTKYLGPEEVFLEDNKIELKTDQQIKKKGSFKYELSTLYKQKPNSKFLFVPREWYYYRLQDTLDQSKFSKGFKRWRMRQFGEEPVLHDPVLTEKTERAMEYYLHHKGYFLAKVQSFSEYKDAEQKKVVVSYEVKPGRQYLIDTVEMISRDTQILKLLYAKQKATFLKKGSPVDEDLYEKEVNRIVNYLRTQGYAYFNSQYISSLEADSSRFEAKLTLEILLPPKDSVHRTYHVGNLYIYPEFDPSNPIPTRIDSIAPGVFFMRDSSEYKIRDKVLLSTLFLKKGDLFNQENYDRTNRQLNKLGIYRFVTIKGEPDPDIPGQINFRIHLTPNKRFELGSDLEVNTSNSPFIGRRLLGVSGNVSFRHRNLFKGAELFINNLEGGVDLNLFDTTNLINTVDIRLQSDLYLPKFVDYLGLYALLDKARVIRRPFYIALQDKGATRISLSYNYLERIDLFSINSLNAGFGYDFRPSNRHRYIINHLRIDYLSPKTTFYFDTLILQKNQNLLRTFDKQLFTGFLLRDFNYTYTGRTNRTGESNSLITRFELSGLEVYLANLLYNGLAPTNKEAVFDLKVGEDTIQFSQYVRLELDFRHYRKMARDQLLVFRGLIGIATPFGFSSTVPYVKQFFAGGPQSVRAWNARAIGPGGYLDPLTQNPGVNPTLFYQTAEFKLDLNAEYRFPIFTLFGVKYEGALFLDAGNVWTTSRDTTRRFSQLRWTPAYDENNEKISDNLFKYLAVGTGLGLRLDFAYFIVRLDLGMKLRNPYPQIDDLGNVEEVFWRSPFQGGWRDLNLNLGLGYPF